MEIVFIRVGRNASGGIPSKVVGKLGDIVIKLNDITEKVTRTSLLFKLQLKYTSNINSVSKNSYKKQKMK